MAIANGGTIVYTDSDGLNPSPTPTVDSVYKVHIFTSSGDLEVIGGGLVDYLIVAGGGAGGRGENSGWPVAYEGGGGGAGGFLTGSTTLSVGSYTIVVGDGGVASDGENSSFNGLVAFGGGKGGSASVGGSGGSGGGGTYSGYPGGLGTEGQGYAGEGHNGGGSGYGGGGGGAAGGGGELSGKTRSYGADGLLSSLSGNPTYYAAGGGGVGWDGASYYKGLGGSSIGGDSAGDQRLAGSGGDADMNSGSGGGGALSHADAVQYSGGKGGSGIVIVRYEYTPFIANGGTIVYTDSDGLNPSPTPTVDSVYKVHIFTSSGDLEVIGGGLVDYLIVAGGGAGGRGENSGWPVAYEGGGGGAGGFLTGSTTLSVGSYTIVVGDGGVASDGENSSFNGLVAFGGGKGGSASVGGSGGSGGGGTYSGYPGGLGTEGQGYAGEGHNGGGSGYGGGGGGAAGGGGELSGKTRSYGADGLLSSLSGNPTYYAAGGGGVGWDGASYYKGLGGSSIGGDSAGDQRLAGSGGDADMNSGSGGGGALSHAVQYSGGKGGSGIVIVRYLYVSAAAPTVQTDPATNETFSSFIANGEVVTSTILNEFTFETDTSDTNGNTVTVVGDVTASGGEGVFVNASSGVQTCLTEAITTDTELLDKDFIITISDIRMSVEQDMPTLLLWIDNRSRNYSVGYAPATNTLNMSMWFGVSYGVVWSLGAGFDGTINHTFVITRTNLSYTATCDGTPLTETSNSINGRSWRSVAGGTFYFGNAWKGLTNTFYVGGLRIEVPHPTTTITERGFWYTDDNKEPTAADYIESETGEFTTGLFDLAVTAPIPGIDYKVKAFATNSIGTGSGDSVVVSLPDITNTPTVETLPESLVATTSFTANGRITQAGQDWYINGVLFTGPVVRVKAGESVNTALSNAAAGSLVIIEPGIYTGLYWVLSKKLYVKGLGSLPSDTVIPGRWDISSGNGGSIIENLTINGAILDNSAVQNQTTIFNKCIVGSSTGNTLHLYANSTWLYFINTKMVRSAGGVTIGAGDYNTPAYVGKVFFQKAELNLPYITGTFAVYGSPGESDYVTTPTSGYGYVYNAVPQGTEKITVDGVPNAATRGFVYSVGTIENPNLLDYDGIYTESGDFGEGSFNHLFSGLTEGTNYRYRAYATNSYGTSYGDPEAVVTTEAEPSLDIYAATSIDLTSFSISGKITYNGGSTPTIRGFVYKIGTGTPTILDKDGIFTESGSFGGDVFSNVFSGLTPNQTYTIAAYATNSYATGYSSTVQVVTLPNLIITTNDCTNITASSFRANATISPSTFGVTVVGFLYTIDEEPYSWQTSSSSGDYTGTANFSKVIGAATNKYYLVKAYVDYRGHTYYGESVLVSTIVLTGITVTPVLPEINIGQTVQLTVVGTYSDSSVVDITNSSFYSAEDLAEFIPIEGQAGAFNVISTTGQIIASVSSGGLIVGMSAGLAKIFIYASEYKTSYNLVVVQPDEGTVDVGGIWDGEIAPGTILPNTNAISIIMDEVMYEGDSQQAYLLGMFDDSPETEAYVSNFDAVWSSSNTDVATVDVGGLIIGVAAGITFIKAVYTLEDSPVQTFTTMVMLRVEAKEGQWVIGQTYQYIPLMPIPNQLFRTTIATSKDRSIDLNIFLCWNKETICWEMTISDPISEEYYVDSIPLFVGEDSMFNLLRLYQYLNIGSCYIVDISGKGTGKPALNNLGVDFLMVWGYTE